MSKNTAIINEYKGNLFEFLVSSKLATNSDLYGKFYKQIPPVFLSSLKTYQNKLYALDKDLYLKLPDWADKVSDKIMDLIDGTITDVMVMGKIAAGSHDERFSEADIKVSAAKEYFFSLKLSKSNSYVNTKSAGIKSILDKYFTHFMGSDSIQESFNNKVGMYFDSFSRELHEIAQIPYDYNFKEWQALKMPSLPGELTGEYRVPLTKYYYNVSKLLFDEFYKYKDENENEFKTSVLKLMGHSNKDIIQVIAFSDKLDLKEIKFIKNIDLLDINLEKTSEDRGYFYLNCPSFSLQVRVKPMNTFLQAALKVNCSVKYFD